MRDLSHIKPFNTESIQKSKDLSEIRPYKPKEVKQEQPSLVAQIAASGRSVVKTLQNVGIGAGAAIHDIAVGTAQAGLDIGENLGLVSPGTTQAFTDSKFANLKTKEEDTIAGQVGQVAGTLGAFALAPGRTIGRATATAAGIGATQVEEAPIGLLGRAGKAVEGAATGYVAGKVGERLFRGSKGITPKGRAAAAVKENLLKMSPKQRAAATQGILASKGTGAKISMGEASQAQDALRAEKITRVTSKAQASEVIRENVNEARLSSLADKLLHKSLPGGIDKAKRIAGKLYENAKQKPLTAQGSARLQQLMSDAQDVMGANASKLTVLQKQGLAKSGKGTVGEFIEVYRQLKSFSSKAAKAGGTDSAVVAPLKAIIDEMGGILKTAAPRLSKADALYAKLKPLETMSQRLKNLKTKPGQAGYVSSQFYKEFLDTPNKAQQFVKTIKDAGGNEAQAKSLVIALNRLQKSPLSKLAEKEVGQKAGGQVPIDNGGFWKALSNRARDLVLGKYDEAYIKAATGTQWQKELLAISKIKNPYSLADRLGTLLAKVAADKTTEEE